MGQRARLSSLALLIALTLFGASAAGSSAQAPHGPPAQMLGLNVAKENIAKVLAGDKRPLYVDKVTLYSLREQSKLLQATLEVGDFKNDAPWTSADFQYSIVARLGSSLPITVRAGPQIVYVTSSKGLTIAIWFKDRTMFTLAVRNGYKQPKELLREALKVNP